MAPVLYSLTFDKAPLGEVIAALTRDSEYNLSIEAEIDLQRPVTVNLKNVTLDEALEMIVVNGAGYAWRMAQGTPVHQTVCRTHLPVRLPRYGR